MAKIQIIAAFDTLAEFRDFVSNGQLVGATVSAVVEEAAETPAETAAPAVVEVSKFETLIDELEDPRFTLRTFTELVEKTGYDNAQSIKNALNSNGVRYVLRSRRRDCAPLIGLAERN